jgi:hypothetical protein
MAGLAPAIGVFPDSELPLRAAKYVALKACWRRADSDRIESKGHGTMKRIYVRPTLTKANQLQLVVATAASD